MRCDFKFWYIRRDDDGFITEAAIRFYEGDYVEGKYIRTKRLLPIEMPHIKKETVVESNNNAAILYTDSDFGRIKTDDELRKFLKKEIGKDKARTPINEQREV